MESNIATRTGRFLRESLQIPGAGIILGLVALLVAINAVGVWGIIYSGREARSELLKDLQLQAIAGARTQEATLASTRADFSFLAQSPMLSKSAATLSADDPMARRWARLDLEATILLFMSSHPAVARIDLFLGEAIPVVSAARREGAPILLPAAEFQPGDAVPGSDHVKGRWGMPGGGEEYIEALISIPALFRLASPTQEYSLTRVSPEERETLGPDDPESERLSTIVTVHDANWTPPINWSIHWTESRAGLVESLSRLTTRFRITLLFNILLMSMAVILGLISVRQVRKGIALEVENRQQSQLRELERQAMHTERLASVGRMAAGLAHEINNPLEGMANYLSLLEDDLREGEYSSSLEFVAKVKEGLRRAAGVTRRVLTLSEPGQKSMTQVDVQKALTETIEFVGGNAIFRGIEIETSLLPGDLLVRGNPVTLGQVFLNLLLNSAEIQKGQGKVEIAVCEDGGQVLITIADRGPGIDPEILPRIFEPFASSRGSTGLGLSICRNIIDQHNGSLEAANREEGGAIFSLRIPLIKDLSEIPGDDAIASARERVRAMESDERR